MRQERRGGRGSAKAMLAKDILFGVSSVTLVERGQTACRLRQQSCAE